jgi:hypothetical protein
MKYSQILLVLYLFLAFFTTSCFKNTDLDQVDALVIRPIVELDLIYFDIDATQLMVLQIHLILLLEIPLRLSLLQVVMLETAL